MFRKFTQWLDSPPTYDSHTHHTCHFYGCQEVGSYRAPKSRYNLDHGIDQWNWFCLIHIRDYNSKWNYYEGMSEQEITKERVSDITWDRPSWPLGGSPFFAGPSSFNETNFKDPFNFFPDLKNSQAVSSPYSSLCKKDKDALALLELSFPFTPEQLRQNYRQLAKRYHPDCNGHTIESQEKIRTINAAYAFLKERYS